MSALRKPAPQVTKPQETKRYTYAEYCTWDDDERWELIDGVPYAMAAPLVIHQEVLRNIVLQIGNFLHKKTCKVFFAPTDVRLNADVREYWIVDPDTGSVIVNIHQDGTYVGKAYDKSAVVPVSILEGLSVNLAEVFTDSEEEA